MENKGKRVSQDVLEAAAKRSFEKFDQAYQMLAAGQEPEKEDSEAEEEYEKD